MVLGLAHGHHTVDRYQHPAVVRTVSVMLSSLAKLEAMMAKLSTELRRPAQPPTKQSESRIRGVSQVGRFRIASHSAGLLPMTEFFFRAGVPTICATGNLGCDHARRGTPRTRHAQSIQVLLEKVLVTALRLRESCCLKSVLSFEMCSRSGRNGCLLAGCMGFP